MGLNGPADNKVTYIGSVRGDPLYILVCSIPFFQALRCPNSNGRILSALKNKGNFPMFNHEDR